MQLTELLESVQLLLAERNQMENEGIKLGKPEMSVGIVSVAMSFAKRIVIMSMAAYVVISVFSYLPKKKKQENYQEV